jgi:hypothetical protein
MDYDRALALSRVHSVKDFMMSLDYKTNPH